MRSYSSTACGATFTMINAERDVPRTDIAQGLQVNGGVAIPDGSDVALEVPDVHRVEAHDGHEEANIRLRETIADEVVLASKNFLQFVERLEERHHRGLVRGLRRRKA